jgi:hypothetical protein
MAVFSTIRRQRLQFLDDCFELAHSLFKVTPGRDVAQVGLFNRAPKKGEI